MTQWAERIDEHESIGLVRSLVSLMDALPPATSQEAADGIDRIHRVARRLGALISETDPYLLAPEMLTPLVSPLSRATVAVEAFVSSSDVGQLVTANAALDEVLRSIGWLDGRDIPNVDSLRESAVSYRRSIGQLVRGLEEQIVETQGRLRTVQEEAEAVRSATEAVAAEQRQLIEAQSVQTTQRLASVEASVDAQKARLDAVISEGQQRFVTVERERTVEWSAQLLSLATEAEDARTKLADDVTATLASVSERAHAVLEDLEAQRAAALEIVNAVGAIAYSGGFGAYADSEKRRADVWAVVTAGAITVLVVVQALLVLVPLLQGSTVVLDWEHLAQRGLLSVPLLFLAGYAAAQSGKHREVEKDARTSELELAAIDPYLVLLPDTERVAIKAETARRMFAQPAAGPGASDAVGAAQLLRLIEEFIKRTGK